MLTGPEKIVRRIVFHFFNKIQDSRRITCYSQELELLHNLLQGKNLPWTYVDYILV